MNNSIVCILVYFITFAPLCYGFLSSWYQQYFPERCTAFWTHNNITGLRTVLHHKLYGQHLAFKAVVNHINGHTRQEEPRKALALSYHGDTGTGKNYVCGLVAEHLYKEGMKSKFVHLISATKEFPHENRIEDYKDKLKSWIEGNVTNCPQSLFIFDEVDKMPAGLVDTLTPYLAFYDNLGGVSYRKVIFIFLSNAGGKDIQQYTLQHWRDGLPREDMKFAELEKVIMNSSLNAESKAGLWQSELISEHMMTSFIPFLPLTRQHLEECVKDSLISNQYYDDVIDIPNEVVEEVLNELTFYPEKEQVFSTSGCKRVEQKVHFVMG